MANHPKESRAAFALAQYVWSKAFNKSKRLQHLQIIFQRMPDSLHFFVS